MCCYTMERYLTFIAVIVLIPYKIVVVITIIAIGNMCVCAAYESIWT